MKNTKLDEVRKLEIKFAAEDTIKGAKKLQERLDTNKNMDPAFRAHCEEGLRVMKEYLDLLVKKGIITKEQAEGRDEKS